MLKDIAQECVRGTPCAQVSSECLYAYNFCVYVPSCKVSHLFIKANAVFSDVCDSFWPELDQGKQALKPSIYSTFSQGGVINMLYIGLKGNIPIILLHVHKAAFHFHTVII